MLNRNEFNLLRALMSRGYMNQRELAKVLGVSLGSANTLFKGLVAKKFVGEKGDVTAAGLRALKPYKVDNAIIMAAGMSSRFAPLSYEKPKGVLKVKGEILIERQIRQLQEVGITDITVVVGYMKEKFFYLQDKFGVDIVVNEDYYRYNNTSTLICVLPKLKNTYICSSDNYFTENVFEPYVFDSYYAATYYPGPVKEWGLKFNKKGLITGIDHYPIDMWCMMGHAYWSKEFSRTFKSILRAEFKKETVRQELWEAVFERNIKRLPMEMRKYPDGVVLEFDTIDDLCAFDPDFFRVTGLNVARLDADHAIAEKLVRQLFSTGIRFFERLGGLTNRSYKTTLENGSVIVVRVPGEGTEAIISRENERRSTELGCRCGVDARLHYFGADGVKVMDYIEGAVTMNAAILRKKSNIKAIAGVFKILHGSGVDTKVPFDVFKMARQYRKVISENRVDVYSDFDKVTAIVSGIKKSVDRECDVHVVPCHNDSLCENWIKDIRGRMYLIDWEYAGMNDAMWDLADTSIEASFSDKEDTLLLQTYFGHRPSLSEVKNFIANKIYVDYLWSLWGKTRVPYDGQAMEDYAQARYNRLKANIAIYNRRFK